MSLGDGYVSGRWDTQDLGQTLYELTKSGDIVRLVKDKTIGNISQDKPEEVIHQHYDISNELFRAMLDPTMSYTCGYWRAGATNLEQAQHDKNELICQKLELEPGMSIVDLGCGFGSFAKHAQENHDVRVIGYTLSKEQAQIAKDFCDVRVEDYRKVTGTFDRVISMGMLEHVDNYREYMKVVYRHLADDGISLFQTIGVNHSRGQSHPWINRHIFPNGSLPSLAQLCSAMEGRLVLEDLENFGTDYAITSQAWWDNFDQNFECSPLFHRMWHFYIMFFKAAFLTRTFQLWQVTMTKHREQQPRRV